MGLILGRKVNIGFEGRLAHPVCSYRMEKLASMLSASAKNPSGRFKVSAENISYALLTLSSPGVYEPITSPAQREGVLAARATKILKGVFPYCPAGPSRQTRDAINSIMEQLHPSTARALADALTQGRLYRKEGRALKESIYYLSLLSSCEAAGIKEIAYQGLIAPRSMELQIAFNTINHASHEEKQWMISLLKEANPHLGWAFAVFGRR